MSKTYQELASENLALFRWELSPEQIPELSECKKVLNAIVNWYNSNPEVTRRVIDDADVSAGLYNQGFFNDWPALYSCFASSSVGHFASTYDDIIACLDRAGHAVDEQPSDPVSNVNEVVNDN
jgi:hypothetical protein